MGDSVVGVDVGSFVIIGNSDGIGVGRVAGYNIMDIVKKES